MNAVLTPPPGVRVMIGARRITSLCRRCGATGRWSRAESDFAYKQIRLHPTQCLVGAS